MAERKALERTSWWEREQTSIGNMLNHWTSILDMDKKIEKVDDLLEGTDGIASINYTSQATAISDLASAIGDLTAFISQIDAELSTEDALFTSSLANGATEEISVIDIEKFTTDNTFDLEETSSMSWGGATVTSNTVKSSLSFSDFLGYSNGSDAVSQYVQGFSDIYKKIYEANKDDYDNIDDFLKTLVHSGEFAHSKDQPMLQFLSDVADVVSLGLKPLIECVTGYNVITGETLSEVEKQMRGIEGLASLGILALTLASGGMAGGVSGILKTLLIDVASGSASVATKSIAKEMGASDGVAMVLGVVAGFTVSRIGTKIMLQMGDVTIETSEEVIRSLEDQIPEVKDGVESSLNGTTIGGNGSLLGEMNSEDLKKYYEFLENGPKSKFTAEELYALSKVDAQLALNRINGNDLLNLRKMEQARLNSFLEGVSGAGVNLGESKLMSEIPTPDQMNEAISNWSAYQKKLVPSKTQANKFNTSTVVYDVNTGEYYYGMNRGVQLSGDDLNTHLSNLLPETSLNQYRVGNCAEVDAVNQALNNGAKIDNLTLYTIDVNTGMPKPMCENCVYTFEGYVQNIITE